MSNLKMCRHFEFDISITLLKTKLKLTKALEVGVQRVLKQGTHISKIIKKERFLQATYV